MLLILGLQTLNLFLFPFVDLPVDALIVVFHQFGNSVRPGVSDAGNGVLVAGTAVGSNGSGIGLAKGDGTVGVTEGGIGDTVATIVAVG